MYFYFDFLEMWLKSFPRNLPSASRPFHWLYHQISLNLPLQHLFIRPFFGNSTSHCIVLWSEAQIVERYGSYFEFSLTLSTSEQFTLPSVVFVSFDCSNHPWPIPLQSQLALRALFALVLSVYGYPSRLFHIWRKKSGPGAHFRKHPLLSFPFQFFHKPDNYYRISVQL